MRDNNRKKLWSVLLWLFLWQLLSLAVSNPFLIAGPAETLTALAAMARSSDFWRSLASSFWRMSGGFLSGSALAVALAAPASRSEGLRIFLSPFVSCVKTVPVASFIILVLIWGGSRFAAFFVSAAVSFPVVYLNTLNGLLAADSGLQEAMELFRLRLSDRIRAFYLPQLMPFLRSGLSVACGMSFKAGVAAEVIGQPLLSVGNGIYRAKIYLETADILAWTAAVVALAWLSEKLISGLAELLSSSAGFRLLPPHCLKSREKRGRRRGERP